MNDSAPEPRVVTPASHDIRPNLDELCQNSWRLIRLRWAAGVGIAGGALVASTLFGIDLPVLPLAGIGLAVLAYNVLLMRASAGNCRSLRFAWRLAWVQILLDWIAMTGVVHFTGGITSPLLIYFVIHAALSGMVLVPSYARGLALVAIGSVAGLAWGEKSGWLPHMPLRDLGLSPELHQNTTYIMAVLFFFGSALLIVSELVATKAQALRLREVRIAQLYGARSTFMRVATHELRSPLGAGLSLMKNIEQGYAGELNPQQTEIVRRVTHRLEGLGTLIDDMLTLAAAQEATVAQVPLEPVNTRAVLERIIERERPNAENKPVTLELDLADEPGTVLAGDVGLAIIVGNVINNAIKYTPPGGSVRVTYRVNRAEHLVVIVVADSGIGIPAADMPHLFTEFFRASNTRSGPILGTGIGLATAKALVDRYSGVVTAQSTEGEGSTFTITLPLAHRSPAATGKSTGAVTPRHAQLV